MIVYTLTINEGGDLTPITLRSKSEVLDMIETELDSHVNEAVSVNFEVKMNVMTEEEYQTLPEAD